MTSDHVGSFETTETQMCGVAPMVLLPSQYEAWLAGCAEALQLVGTHPDAEAFQITTV